MIRHIRQTVNTKIYNTIYLNIKNTSIISEIDQLLQYTDKYNRTKFNNLKALPCSPTISNITKLINHYSWLYDLVDTRFVLGQISNIKLSQFAEYTSSLDASDVREMSEVKKYALVVILINNSQKEVRDGLATMYCKTVFKLHADSKRELERLQDIHSLTTQKIAETLEKVTIE